MHPAYQGLYETLKVHDVDMSDWEAKFTASGKNSILNIIKIIYKIWMVYA